MVTSHVRLVTPAVTNVYCRYALAAEPTCARASHAPSAGPLLIVAVTSPPGGELVALAVRPGPVRGSERAAEVPPPGAGGNTVMFSTPALERSLAGIPAWTCPGHANV